MGGKGHSLSFYVLVCVRWVTHNYPPHAYQNIKTKPNMNKTPNIIPKQKWATFTYIGKETRTITKLFKNTNIRTAYKTKKILYSLQPKIPNIENTTKAAYIR
jgi:hypothetical protein